MNKNPPELRHLDDKKKIRRLTGNRRIKVNDSYEKEISWLESLRPQPKQEWSEEDEKRLSHIISLYQKTMKEKRNMTEVFLFLN